MTEHTRDPTGAAAAARYLKGLERRVQSVEEDLRGDEAAVPLERTATVGLELQAGPTTVYRYDADSVHLSEPDWGSINRREQFYRLRDNHSPVDTTTSPAVTTHGLREWVAPALDPVGQAPAFDALLLGTGDGRWLSTNDSLYDADPVRVEVAQRQITSSDALGRYLIDADELNNIPFTEAGLVARDGSILGTHGPLDPPLEKTADEIVRVDMPLAFAPVPTEDGTLTRAFRRWMAYQSITEGSRREPLTTAAIGSTMPDAPDEFSTLPNALGEVPVVDWSPDAAGEDPMITIAVDSTRLNGNTLRAMGITNEDPIASRRLHSIAEIDPPIEKTSAVQATLNTILDIEHATEDIDQIDTTILPDTAEADTLPVQGVSVGVGDSIRPPPANATVESETPGVQLGDDIASLPPRARATATAPTPSVSATEVTTELVDDFAHNDLNDYYNASSYSDPSSFETTTYSRSNWPIRGSRSLRHARNGETARVASSDVSGWRSTDQLPYYPRRGDTIVAYNMLSRSSPSTSQPAFHTRFRWGWQGPASNYDITLHYRSNQLTIDERSNTYGSYTLDSDGMGEWNAYEVIRIEIDWRSNGSIRARVYDDATDTLRADVDASPTRWTPTTGGIEFITVIDSSYSGNIYWDWVHVER